MVKLINFKISHLFFKDLIQIFIDVLPPMSLARPVQLALI